MRWHRCFRLHPKIRSASVKLQFCFLYSIHLLVFLGMIFRYLFLHLSLSRDSPSSASRYNSIRPLHRMCHVTEVLVNTIIFVRIIHIHLYIILSSNSIIAISVDILFILCVRMMMMMMMMDSHISYITQHNMTAILIRMHLPYN